ncbi:YSIRK signal domain/LPXTG anchor domain surface protein [Streptococcus pseudopneumoniae]|uniref:Surface anchored protein n=1 Tax=Streptococcus pseudopneumoniae TaxID=257758 RepID=A0A2P0A0D1_9STRE|nr:YSIRK signal domain/LPXTG anchor domain surface protein [Streptococcus pseudopneumoniae]CEY61318.1 surface anchored protein [Streptococcus pseudopneumoniae]CIP10337.1 surface anchored protein [Streptococcus pseudopneumoniae]
MDKKVSMSRSERLRREKVTRYSIRKYSFGAASVAVAALFMFLGNGAVSAAENGGAAQDGAAVAASPNGGGEADPGDGATSTGAENQKPVAEILYSIPSEKKIFVYNEEDAGIEIPVHDDSGEILFATFKKGSNQSFKNSNEGDNKLDLEFGYTGTVINRAESTSAAGTSATQGSPAKITISGKPDATLKAKPQYTKTEEQTLNIGTRFVKVGDKQGLNNVGDSRTSSDPGYMYLVLKSQTYKYSIQEPETNADKISVSNIDNLTEQDIEKIKTQLKVEYSKTSQDARLASQRGTALTNRDSVVESVGVADGNVTVTYKDGSTDVVPVANVARTNQPPTVDIPYSDPTEREIYVYSGEDNSFDIKIKDDADKIKSAKLLKGGNNAFQPVSGENDKVDTEYGYTANEFKTETPASETNPAVITYSGRTTAKNSLSQATLDRGTKGENPQRLALGWRYVRVTDLEGTDFTGSGQQKNNDHAFNVVNKPQKQKYDIKTPEEADKVVVTDPAAVTEEEFAKVKEKVKLEYSKTNPDKQLESKRGQEVENQNSKIQSITKNGNDLLVTYTDGSIDRRPLTEFTTLNKQPAIDAVNKAAEDKIAEINATADPNATDDEKQAAIAKVNADKEKALAAINDPNLTTKAALDQAQTEGTTAIAADNPVVAKKAEAKAAIEAARKAKEDAINADINLSEAEKTAAIAKANEAARAATEKIDAATTDAAVNEAQTEATTAISKVNPIAKENAKAAIANALTAKNDEIDKRTDLSQAEKDAAKAEAQKLADAELAKIDAQPDNEDTEDAARATQKLVDAAEDKGVADVTSVTPVAKDAAKKAVADELAKKEAEIDARQDLTAEEKDAAKKEAQAKAAEANQAIDAQPDVAATPEEAKAAQEQVDAAKEKGVEAIKAVNPETTAKAAADKAIDDALAAKNKAIDERTDLTDAEKKAAKDKAKEEADKAKAAVAAATSDAEVAKAKEAGESAVGAVNPVAKDAAKKAVADELAKKEAEIDARQDLTAEEKAKVKAEAQARAAEANKAIDAQPDVTTTPEESRKVQGAVDSAKEHGVAAIKAVNPETTTKAAAKKAIDDKLAEQLKAIENTPDATDEEKAEAAEKATALAKEAKQAIDIATTDSEVKKLQDDANAEIGKVLPVVEDKPNARKAIDEQTKAKKEEIDARTDLSPKAKENLKDKADQIAAEAKKLVDAANKEADVNKIQDADKSAIRAVGDINRPIDKVLVNNPANLKAEEKAKILEEVRKVNPTAKEVKYNDAGNIEVTTANGDKGIINPTDLVKTLENLDNGKGGNDINKPLDKVIIKDKSMLTESEKAQIIAAVKSVNPNSIVLLDADGTVSVSTPEGQTATIPSTELVRTKEDTAKSDAGNGEIVKPADKVVGEPTDSAAQAKVEEKLRKLNPEAKSVKFDDKGNATVTLNDGTVATIPWKDLFKSPEDATKPNAGNDIVKPADKTVVANSDKLTVAEKKAIEEKVKAVNPGATVVVDDKGNATVTTPEGKTAVIPATDLTKSAADAAKPNAGNDVNTPAAKTVAANLDKLTEAEKKAIEEKVKAVNPGSTVVVDDKGNATVTTPEGKTAVIPATDLVKTQDDITKENAGNDVNTPAAKTVVADPDALTPEEKKAIEEKVKAVNPGSTVVVDDKGNATVTKADGTVLNIPALDLVIPAGNLADEAKTAKVKTPAFRTLVGNKDNLTEDEKAAVKKAIEAVNSGATVVVDDKGNATVTLDGNTVSIVKDQLVKTESDVTAKNSGDNINLDFEKETVADFTNLTDSEKEAAKAKIKAANADVVDVLFDKAGNATVVTKDGKVLAITAEAIFKQAPSAQNNGATNTEAKVDKAKLADAIRQLDGLIIQESAKLDAETAKEATDLLADAKKVFANADATQADVAATVKRIEDFLAKVSPATNHASPANDQAAQTPAVVPAQAANANQAATNVRTVAKELPNTGTADSTVAMVAAAASALLGLGLAGRRRKEDEEA